MPLYWLIEFLLNHLKSKCGALLLFFASLSEIPTSESKNEESISFCITYFMTRCPISSLPSLVSFFLRLTLKVCNLKADASVDSITPLASKFRSCTILFGGHLDMKSSCKSTVHSTSDLISLWEFFILRISQKIKTNK